VDGYVCGPGREKKYKVGILLIVKDNRWRCSSYDQFLLLYEAQTPCYRYCAGRVETFWLSELIEP
jgi:hypothetical protein